MARRDIDDAVGMAISTKPLESGEDGGGIVDAALPMRKRLNHRSPLSIDVSSAWYFITLCAAERFDYGRAVSMKPPATPFIEYANDILDAARFRHERFAWRLALLLIMPDHIHLIAHFPTVSSGAAVSSKPPYHCGMQYVIADLKRWLSTKYNIRFQRDFFDTRLRDDAHFAEKYEYILGNPVRKGLCATPSDWPHVIAFTRDGTPVGCDDPIALVDDVQQSSGRDFS